MSSLRRRAIDATALLDTEPERRFDRFTELARTLWRAPMATITLFDDSRAFFKSRPGLPIVDMPTPQTFCASVLERDAAVVVPDALADPAFRALPGVRGELGIRFYAGQPVRDAHGTVIGTVCIYDRVPRTFDEHDLEVLAQLGRCVEAEVDSTRDRDHALRVQSALLPRSARPVVGYSFAATSMPTRLVAGDVFDHLTIDGVHHLLVGDVMGKGTAAAILMAAFRTAVRACALADRPDRDPGRLLAEARDVVQSDLDSAEAFVTAFLASADPASGQLVYADAGHGLSVVVGHDGSTRRLASHGLPVGVDPTCTWSSDSLVLEPGQMLVCCSDGLLELMEEDDVEVAVGALVGTGSSPRDLVTTVERRAGSSALADDVTVLAIRRDDA